MNKILSIIIPTYNMEKYLKRCLDSLLIKNLDDIEVLVVNDGSKDCSSEIAHEYNENYPESFYVIDKPNGNYGSCINSALKRTTGKYVKVLDADDHFNTEYLQVLVSQLRTSTADLVLTDYDIVNEFGDKTGHVGYQIKPNANLPFYEVSKKRCFLNLAMHGITYRTKIFDGLNYEQSEGISYTDQEWIFTPMSRVNDVLYIPITVYQYLVGREGQTMDPQILLKNISHTIKGIYHMCEEYNKLNLYNLSITTPYFDYILIKRFKYVYRNYLLTHADLPESDLMLFESKLKEYGEQIYELTDSIILAQKVPVHFVRLWRKTGYNNKSLVMKLLCFFDKIIA